MLGRPSPSPRVAARVRELFGEHDADPSTPGDLSRLGDPSALGDPSMSGELPTGRTVSIWQRVSARIPVRLDPGRRAALGMGVAVAVAAVVTAIWLAAQRPHAVDVAPAPPSIAGAASPIGSALVPTGSPSPTSGVAGAGATGAATSEVVVDVAGKVRHPGLYRLRPGSRIDDAVRRAGGPLHGVDLTSLSLAARVVDGQQIVVGGAQPGPPGSGGGGAADAGGAGLSGGAPGAPVDLNTATADQLEALPGVGPVLAQHILDWRAAHGGFSSVDQLNDVSGIGDVKFGELRSLVST